MRRDRSTLRRALAHVEDEERLAELATRRTENKQRAINRLPDDLLGEILLLSMTPLGKKIWSSAELKTCHHWRRVAEQFPRIWSRLFVTEEISTECVDLWVERSAAAALHVDFAAPPTDNDYTFRPLWRKIMQHSHRVQSLSLVLRGTWWIDCILPITYRVDNLRELKISLDRGISSRTLDLFEPLITPQLRQLIIKSPQSGALMSIFMPPLLQNSFVMPSRAASGLVTLAIQDQAPPDAVCEFLRECQKIQKLLWDLQSYRVDTWTPAPTSIPTLCHLWVAGDLAVRFLRIANLPALRRLVVSNTCNQADVCKAILEFKTITRLRLDFHEPQAQDVRSIYESLHHLEYLSYKWREDTFKAILVLTEWEEGNTSRIWLCPQIKQLHLAIGEAVTSRKLWPNTVRSCLEKVMRVRARSVEAPLTVILDDSEATKQFTDLGVQRVPLTSFPTAWV